MPTCEACRARRQTAEEASADPNPEASVSILLRAWREGDEVRCRLLRGTHPAPVRGTMVAQGVDAICEAVRRWLLEL
jgi:hypothetical protein